jgi:hypothetical protein
MVIYRIKILVDLLISVIHLQMCVEFFSPTFTIDSAFNPCNILPVSLVLMIDHEAY